MSECVILFRNTQNNRVGFVIDGDDPCEIAVFPHRDAAIDVAAHIPILRAFPYQIVELDEL
jgi:hypothetical protein